MSYTDSVPVQATCVLVGVWFHEAADPQGTAQTFPLGPPGRSRTVDTMPSLSYYAGRMYPVAEYGEHEAETVPLTVHLAHGETWYGDVARARALASVKYPLVYRDNRGRVIEGILTGYRETDQDFGTAIDWTVTRVDVPASGVGVL